MARKGKNKEKSVKGKETLPERLDRMEENIFSLLAALAACAEEIRDLKEAQQKNAV